MKKWSFLLVTILLVGICPTGAQSADAVLGILEVRGIDNLANAAATFTEAVGNPVPGEVISQFLLKGLLSETGAGINRLGNMRLIWLDNDDPNTGEWVVCLPVEDGGADYLKSLGEAGWANDDDGNDGDIQRFTAPDPAPVPWPEIFFAPAGSRFLASGAPGGLAPVEAILPNLPPILPAEGNLALQLRPAAIVDAYSPQIEGVMDTLLKAAGKNLAIAQAYKELTFRTYLAVACAVEEVTYGVGISSSTLNLHARIAPKAGTTLATWLTTLKAPSAKANVVNQPDALFADTMNLGDASLLAGPYYRYYSKVIDILADKLPAAKAQSYLAQSRAIFSLLGGNVSWAIYPPTRQNPFRLVEYIDVKDPVALRAIYSELIALENDVMQAMMSIQADEEMPFTLSLTPGESREVDGVPVDRLVYSLELDEDVAAILPKGIPTKFEIELAWLSDGIIVCFGESELTDQMIASARSGGGSAIQDLPSWKAAHPDPEATIGASHVALFDLLRAYVALADQAFGTAYAAEIPDGPGNMACHNYVQDGTLAGRVRIKLADISAAIQKIEEAQARAQQASQANWEKMMREDGDVEFPEGDLEPMEPFEDEPVEENSLDDAESEE